MIKHSIAGTAAAPSNKFLNTLTPPDQALIFPALELFEMKKNQVLRWPYEPDEYVYFPETGIVSLVSAFEDGSVIEAGITGNEGFAGIAAVLSGSVSPREAVVQAPGTAFRIRAAGFKKAFDHSGTLRDRTLNFVYSFYNQVSQNGACNKCHTIEQRLAKWLLMFQDRAQSDLLVVTQEFAARMLGAQRPTVSITLYNLRAAGPIDYSRGSVKIRDRKKLEERACECYCVIKEQYAN